MINVRNFCNSTSKRWFKNNDNIQKIVIGKGDDYTAGCLLDYPYFKKYYKLTAIELSKQKNPDADPKAIQQNNFTGNLDWDGNTQMSFIIVQVKEAILDFSTGKVKFLWFCLNIILM